MKPPRTWVGLAASCILASVFGLALGQQQPVRPGQICAVGYNCNGVAVYHPFFEQNCVFDIETAYRVCIPMTGQHCQTVEGKQTCTGLTEITHEWCNWEYDKC